MPSPKESRTCATALAFWGTGLLATVFFLPVPVAASSFGLGGSFFPAFVPFSVRIPLMVSSATLGVVGRAASRFFCFFSFSRSSCACLCVYV